MPRTPAAVDKKGNKPRRKMRPNDGGVASVDRAISVLELFRDHNTALALNEISEATGLYKSTLLRIFQSLEKAEFLEKNEEGRYRIGLGIQQLGSIAQASFNQGEAISASLRRLTAATLESAAYYVIMNDKRLCLYRSDSPQTIRATVAVGEALPLEVGASGRVLTTFSEGWNSDLRESLVIASAGERVADLAAVAVPVFDQDNKLSGALTVAGPLSRFSDKLVARASHALLEEARALSIQMGARRDCTDALAARLVDLG